MKILVGLGNKGKEYSKTYHNLGFLAMDYVVSHFNAHWMFDKKKNSYIADFLWQEEKILCIKPNTFMNISGVEVQKILSFFKITKENLYVFVDDVDLPCGKIKAVLGGGNAGHNGIKSIEQKIGKEFNRIRLGCGRPDHNQQDLADYVLDNISSEKQPIFQNMYQRIVQILDILLFDSVENFYAKINNLNT